MSTATPSYQLLAQVLGAVGRKALSYSLGYRDRASIDKWCEEPPSDSNPDGSGARNPLDTVRHIIILCKQGCRPQDAHDVARWVCNTADGFFTPYPAKRDLTDGDVVACLNADFKEFSEYVEAVRGGWFGKDSPRRFTLGEIAKIRREADDLMAAIVQLQARLDNDAGVR